MKLIKYIKLIKSFFTLYKDYNYDGDDLRFIINQYETVLVNRTNVLSKPTHCAREVIDELDKWYLDDSAQFTISTRTLQTIKSAYKTTYYDEHQNTMSSSDFDEFIKNQIALQFVEHLKPHIEYEITENCSGGKDYVGTLCLAAREENNERNG